MDAPFNRYPHLQIARKGQTWRLKHKDSAWPLILYARDIYYGTGRLLATLSMDRHDEGSAKPTKILTGAVDLLTTSQRKSFAKEAAERLERAQGTDPGKESSFTVPVISMIDALLERLNESKAEISAIDINDVEIPADMTPKYVLWPIVPVSRPGMLVAPSGSGKSTAAAMMAISVGTGHAFLPELQPRVTGAVVYIGQEEDAIQMRMRIQMILRGHDLTLPPKTLIYMRLPRGSLIDSAERIAEECADVGAKLLIVDSAQATWGNGDDAVREYASKWFNAIDLIAVPTLIIEHPNLLNTKKGGDGFAAGTSVKRDRAGHVWGVKSVELPVREGYPYRYHVTLTDSKRNYVSRQPNISYEVAINGHEWVRFMPAETLTAETVVDVSHLWEAIAAHMRDPAEEREEWGWTVADLAKEMHQKNDFRIRQELQLDVWRPSKKKGEGWQERPTLVEGTGSSRTNPARYLIEARYEPVQLSISPGENDLMN